MKKIIQTSSGFSEADSDTNPEYFSEQELTTASRKNGIIDAYNQAIIDLQAIQNTAAPTNAEVILAVKREAAIIERLLKFIRMDLI